MPAKKSPPKSVEASVVASEEIVSPPSAVHFAFYAMGLRIGQLMMLDAWIEGQVSRSSFFPSADIIIRQSYSLVAVAFERLARKLGLTLELAQRGHQIIAEGSSAWSACSKEDVDNLGNTALCMGDLESLVRDVSISLGAAGAAARDWLELGLMIAEGNGDACLPFEKRVWTWREAQRVEKRLAALGLRRSDVFPEPVDLTSSGGLAILPGCLSGWHNLEAGLMRLADLTEPGMGQAWSASTPSEKPFWDAKTGELRLGSQFLRRVRVMARPSSIQQILDAFQAAGWPPRIEDPITKGQHADQVRQIVLSLNQGLDVIRFHVQEGGKAITWSRT